MPERSGSVARSQNVARAPESRGAPHAVDGRGWAASERRAAGGGAAEHTRATAAPAFGANALAQLAGTIVSGSAERL